MKCKIAAAVAVLAAMASAAVLAPTTARADSPAYITLLFSRTEVGAATACVEDDANVATLLGTVEPYLASLGMTATGTLNTFAMGACTHNDSSVTATWEQASQLVQDGWAMVPHLYMGLPKMDKLTAQQDYDYTCGQATTITANLGLTANANGMLAYPGLDTGRKGPAPEVANLQNNYASHCYSWGRSYYPGGLTTSADNAYPYWQHTESVVGHPKYTQPHTIIDQVNKLQPDQWLTLQAYVLVTGSGPAWDCVSATHTSTDVERYCYSDWQAIVQAIKARMDTGAVVVTDPLTAGLALGRTP